MSSNVRNILIIVGIAAVVVLIGSTGFAVGQLLLTILSLLILAGLLYFGYTLYRQNKSPDPVAAAEAQARALRRGHPRGAGAAHVLVLGHLICDVPADVRHPGWMWLRDLPRLAGSPPVLLMATAPLLVRRATAALAAACALLVVVPAVASAAPPANDSATTPTEISTSNLSRHPRRGVDAPTGASIFGVDTTEATPAPDDPVLKNDNESVELQRDPDAGHRHASSTG